MKNLFFVIILLCSFSVLAQEHTEVIKKELQFSQISSNNLLTINNVNGNISVEGYSGKKILLEVKKTISGKTQAKLEKGKREVELGIHQEDDGMIIYTKTPCSDVRYEKSDDNTWHWRTWKNNCNWGSGVHFNFDIVVKIPYDLSIDVSTVNDGDVLVKNISGEVKANNINGSIALEKIAGKTHAHTINGDVDITYAKNPGKDSKYYSLNGDINAYFQKGLSAKLTFESFNGDFFTNIDNITMEPTVVKKKAKGKGIKYKVGGKSNMKIGNGTVLLDFETFNGNVYVKEL
ncbi:MAG: DUF4097 domain-containing protein [Saprospiraceae bacterium]